MPENKSSIEWRIIGETVPGASHLRAGIPNQDALFCARQSSRELPIIVSMADGHGSAKCFRSDRGSRFAVRKSTILIGEFLDARRGNFDLSEIEGESGHLAKEIVRCWREAVDADLKSNPFSEKEFEVLGEKADAKARILIEENPYLAYGTTLLSVAIEENFVFYWQLGDGAILNISGAGEVAKPLAEDSRLLANETTSLCLPDADKDFRFALQKTSDQTDRSVPALILISTDGYLNSFSSEAGFYQAGTDITGMLAAEGGHDAVSDNLKAWLEEATRMGSGDDCTVAVIYSPESLKQPENLKSAEIVETKIIETPPSPEVSQALAVLTDSQTVTRDNMEDVTVTITIKKDKNKKHIAPAPPIVETVASSKDDDGETRGS